MTFEELDNEVAGWRTLLKTNPQEEAAPPFAVFEGWETTTPTAMGFPEENRCPEPHRHWVHQRHELGRRLRSTASAMMPMAT